VQEDYIEERSSAEETSENERGSVMADGKFKAGPTASGSVTINTATGNGCVGFAHLGPSDNRPVHTTHYEELYLGYTNVEFTGLIDLMGLGTRLGGCCPY